MSVLIENWTGLDAKEESSTEMFKNFVEILKGNYDNNLSERTADVVIYFKSCVEWNYQYNDVECINETEIIRRKLKNVFVKF